MRLLWIWLWIGGGLLQSLGLQAQDSLQLSLRAIDQAPSFWPEAEQQQRVASADLQRLLAEKQRALQAEGYLAASLDTLFRDSAVAQAFFFVGPRYQWLSLRNGNIPTSILAEISFKAELFAQKKVRPAEVVRLQEKLLRYAENNGYPFAAFRLDSFVVDSQQLSACLYWEKGPRIRLTKLEVEAPKNSSVRISKYYLASYLGLRLNDLYDEAQIQKISKRIRDLPFLRSYQSPKLLFRGEEAELRLFLANQNASRFDFLLGLQPNEDPVTGLNRVRLTGQILADLYNPFGTGKRIRIQWQALQQGRTEIEAQLVYPYLLRTPLGVDAQFELYRRDSSYIDIISDLGLQYLFDGGNYLKAFWRNHRTNLLEIDTNRVRQQQQLPENLDLQVATYGLEYYLQRLDYRFNPRRGLEWTARLGLGLKRIFPNSNITNLQAADFDFSSLYDSLALQSLQVQVFNDFSYFLPFGKRFTLMSRLRVAGLFSEAPLLRNELFRLGGNQLLRGFDEESLQASWYNVLTFEFRYLLGTNSFAYLFSDLAYVEERRQGFFQADRPFGFGAGLALETPVGLFALSYALGSQQGNPILFRNAKVHFGYISRF